VRNGHGFRQKRRLGGPDECCLLAEELDTVRPDAFPSHAAAWNVVLSDRHPARDHAPTPPIPANLECEP